MSTTPIRLVCLDMAGTTVADDGLVVAAFTAALDVLGVEAAAERARMTDYVTATMGESKITVFRALAATSPAVAADADAAETWARTGNLAFETAYGARIGETTPIPGAEAVFETLRERGVRLALTTGFSRATADALLEHLGWAPLVDLSLTPADVGGRGRPHPDMVLAAAARLADDDPRAVAVAGDTAGDVRSGLAAGAPIVAGVLTGAHGRTLLLDAGATHVLDSVASLPELLSDH